jgi:putative aldouronate transport system permease protein
MKNPLVSSVAEVFDTYTYTQGILLGNVSLGIAVGIFKSFVSLFLIVLANNVIKKIGQEGIY